MSERIRVLVVDDSAFTRKVLRQILEAHRDLEVVGTARDGLEALEKIDQLRPDVVTLDLIMPGLDGLGVLRALDPTRGPRVVVVSISESDSVLAAEAFEVGAVDLVRKPTALATHRLLEIGSELVEKVRVAARARPLAAARGRPAPLPPSRPAVRSVVVIGTSTGGPQALTRVLTALPARFLVPIAIALHIPESYTLALARRLADASAIAVVEASEGLALAPGTAILARGGSHLALVRGGDAVRCALDTRPRASHYKPSVDVLFESAVAVHGASVLGVVLTGMGDDGLAGARAIRAAGGAVLTEAESSCVVDGMPRSVREAGLSSAEAPIDLMASAIVAWTTERLERPAA